MSPGEDGSINIFTNYGNFNVRWKATARAS
jgi:hypothetical protein